MIYYKDLIDLGFKRADMGADEVYFNEHGYEYFYLKKKLGKRHLMEWSPEAMIVELFFMGPGLKKDDVLNKTCINDIDAVKSLINLYKTSKGKS